jgi:hypothetical protein
MFEFLVTSKARRRLLTLLWSEGESGSVSELAQRAGVGFASAYRELQAMRRLGLVASERRGGATVFSANRGHPSAAAISTLVTSHTERASGSDDAVRGRLAALGAPLLARSTPKPRGSVEETLVAGVALAHRDPAVARSLPVAFYRQADRVNPDRLSALARERSEKAAVGLFLDLTAQLTGDRRFSTWARPLRDRRVHARRPFFYTRSAALSAASQPDRSPSVAHRWGFRLDLPLEDFVSLFDKAERAS